MNILGIDPGSEHSGYVLYGPTDRKLLLAVDPIPNAELRDFLKALDGRQTVIACEWMEAHGQPVGAEVFETAAWIGHFEDVAWCRGITFARIKTSVMRRMICHSNRANDSVVRQALIDEFGPGKEKAIGLKASPGPLYAVKGHAWSALAIAIAWLWLQDDEAK